MDSSNSGQLPEFGASAGDSFSLPAYLVAGLEIGLLAAFGIGAHYALYGSANLIYCLVSLFLSINLLICYWEICLFLERDYIEERNIYWTEWREQTGKSPAVAFLATKVSKQNLFSSTLWADVWSTYSLYDGSYADRRCYGFNADVGNGFVTLIPSIILHLGITFTFLPANIIGILGVMMFWQWLYCTSAYWMSFFVAGRHKLISTSDLYIYIWGTNAPWALFSVLGLYTSIRLVLDNSYAVFGI